MTDRISALTIVLEKDIRDDDAKPLIEAIKMMRGVLSVEPHVKDAIGEVVARRRFNREAEDRLYALLAELRNTN